MAISVAFDKSAEDARPWIEAAKPAHPSLIDTRHRVADLYNMVNVPTILWIDEKGVIVRPNDVAFGDDTWKHVTGMDAAPHANALRAWVRGEAPAYAPDRARELVVAPSDNDQLARAEFGLGQWLFDRGETDAAARHFERGGELAPHDFNIRRGTMPMRGIDAAGPEFRKMVGDWTSAGHSYYLPLPAE